MKSITQNSQLDDNLLKGILNNDGEVMKKLIDASLSSSSLMRDARDFAEDLGERIRIMFQILIEKTISEEFFQMLEEAAGEGKDTSRNGYYRRKIRSALGDFDIQIPRARFLNFTTRLLDRYGHNLGKISEDIIRLYKEGMTASGIVGAIAGIDGIGLSQGTVQKIVAETVGDALRFNSEKIDDCPFVYLDATYVPFKRAENSGKSVEKEGILVALGVTPSGYRKVLGYVFGETEKKSLWISLLRNLKERGLRNPRMVITDGLSGMPEAVREVFPNALHQRCIVHFVRNLRSYVRKSEAKAIGEDFAKVYGCRTKEEALREFRSFSEFWGSKYIGIRNMLSMAGDNIFSYYSFPEEIRSGLYTSNAIEGFNSKLKRDVRKRILMNSEDNATIVITAVCKSYNGSRLGRRMNGLSLLSPEKRAELGFSF